MSERGLRAGTAKSRRPRRAPRGFLSILRMLRRRRPTPANAADFENVSFYGTPPFCRKTQSPTHQTRRRQSQRAQRGAHRSEKSARCVVVGRPAGGRRGREGGEQSARARLQGLGFAPADGVSENLAASSVAAQTGLKTDLPRQPDGTGAVFPVLRSLRLKTALKPGGAGEPTV